MAAVNIAIEDAVWVAPDIELTHFVSLTARMDGLRMQVAISQKSHFLETATRRTMIHLLAEDT